MDSRTHQDRMVNPVHSVPREHPKEKMVKEESSRARQLSDSMMLLQSIQHKRPSYREQSSQSMPSWLRAPCSPTSNVPRVLNSMEDGSSKPSLLGCRPLPKEAAC